MARSGEEHRNGETHSHRFNELHMNAPSSYSSQVLKCSPCPAIIVTSSTKSLRVAAADIRVMSPHPKTTSTLEMRTTWTRPTLTSATVTRKEQPIRSCYSSPTLIPQQRTCSCGLLSFALERSSSPAPTYTRILECSPLLLLRATLNAPNKCSLDSPYLLYYVCDIVLLNAPRAPSAPKCWSTEHAQLPIERQNLVRLQRALVAFDLPRIPIGRSPSFPLVLLHNRFCSLVDFDFDVVHGD
ncbi:hypothetical protein BC567DRAFT_22698 [Phyllosticta citribraziliensis]